MTARKLAALPAATSETIASWREHDADRLEVEAQAFVELLDRIDDALEIAEAHDDELLGSELRRIAALVRDRRNEYAARSRERRNAGR